MAVEEIIDISAFLITQLGKIGLWLKAIGVVIVLWIIFQVVSAFYNMRRMAEIKTIKSDVVRIEEKIDRILKRKD